MRTLETTTRLDGQAKGFLAKATPTTPNKERIVFVLIHQKNGFVNAKIRYAKNTKFQIAQKKEMEIICTIRTQNVKSYSVIWAAKLKCFKDIETMAQGRG